MPKSLDYVHQSAFLAINIHKSTCHCLHINGFHVFLVSLYASVRWLKHNEPVNYEIHVTDSSVFAIVSL